MKQKIVRCWILVAFAILFSFSITPHSAHASSLYAAVPVSDAGTDNTLANSNTARKVAVAPNGNIYVVYHGASHGVRIARSTNRGQSFGASIQLDTANADPEVAVDQSNIVYVVWINPNSQNIMLARSTDLGLTFSTSVVGSNNDDCLTGFCTAAHIAVSNPYVYIIMQDGTTLFKNSAQGVGSFTTTTVDSTRVFADVHIDPLTGYVYAQTDDPNVLYFVSTDHGQTFSAAMATFTNINYSISALSSYGSNKFLYVSGLGGEVTLRVNLTNNTLSTVPFSSTTGDQTRSLATDSMGDVIDGFISGGNGEYEVSPDQGVTVHAPVVVAPAAFISISANPVTGDIVAAYEQSGSIFVSVYQNELIQPAVAQVVAPVVHSHGGVNMAAFALPNISAVDFNINNGQLSTENSAVTLNIKAGPDVTSMAISNTADFQGIGIEPIATTKAWTLCTDCQSGRLYTVYLKLYTAFGQSVGLSRTITYSTTTTSTSTNITTATFVFRKNLKLGSNSSDVIKLEQYLNSHGFPVALSGAGSLGHETSVFSNATKNAVMKLQAAYPDQILYSGHLIPDGIFGPSTRAFVNAHP